MWETYCSEFFGYSKLFGEVDAQRVIHIGVGIKAIPDIILLKNNYDVFDIELKKYNMDFDEKMEDQIKSYLEIFHLSVGMVVCKKIYLYSYDYSKSELNKIIIEFKEDDANGIRLIELLQKENFDENNIKDFIKESLITKINIQNIKNEVNSELVKKLVVDYLKTKYTQNEIEEGIKDLNFYVKENINFSIPKGAKITATSNPIGQDNLIEIIKNKILTELPNYNVHIATSYVQIWKNSWNNQGKKGIHFELMTKPNMFFTNMIGNENFAISFKLHNEKNTKSILDIQRKTYFNKEYSFLTSDSEKSIKELVNEIVTIIHRDENLIDQAHLKINTSNQKWQQS